LNKSTTTAKLEETTPTLLELTWVINICKILQTPLSAYKIPFINAEVLMSAAALQLKIYPALSVASFAALTFLNCGL
jgi:hypothetical protein